MSWSNTTDYPYFYPPPTKCDVPTDVWCRIDNDSAVFEDLEILAEGQRRLRAAAADPSGRPFFVAAGKFHGATAMHSMLNRTICLYTRSGYTRLMCSPPCVPTHVHFHRLSQTPHTIQSAEQVF